MKFKTKEELMEDTFPKTIENIYITTEEKCYRINYLNGLNQAFNSFAERVEFYKKYRDDITQFENDYPKIKQVKTFDVFDDVQRNVVFNYWLFDYCFEDVVE